YRHVSACIGMHRWYPHGSRCVAGSRDVARCLGMSMHTPTALSFVAVVVSRRLSSHSLDRMPWIPCVTRPEFTYLSDRLVGAAAGARRRTLHLRRPTGHRRPA